MVTVSYGVDHRMVNHRRSWSRCVRCQPTCDHLIGARHRCLPLIGKWGTSRSPRTSGLRRGCVYLALLSCLLCLGADPAWAHCSFSVTHCDSRFFWSRAKTNFTNPSTTWGDATTYVSCTRQIMTSFCTFVTTFSLNRRQNSQHKDAVPRCGHQRSPLWCEAVLSAHRRTRMGSCATRALGTAQLPPHVSYSSSQTIATSGAGTVSAAAPRIAAGHKMTGGNAACQAACRGVSAAADMARGSRQGHEKENGSADDTDTATAWISATVWTLADAEPQHHTPVNTAAHHGRLGSHAKQLVQQQQLRQAKLASGRPTRPAGAGTAAAPAAGKLRTSAQAVRARNAKFVHSASFGSRSTGTDDSESGCFMFEATFAAAAPAPSVALAHGAAHRSGVPAAGQRLNEAAGVHRPPRARLTPTAPQPPPPRYASPPPSLPPSRRNTGASDTFRWSPARRRSSTLDAHCVAAAGGASADARSGACERSRSLRCSPSPLGSGTWRAPEWALPGGRWSLTRSQSDGLLRSSLSLGDEDGATDSRSVLSDSDANRQAVAAPFPHLEAVGRSETSLSAFDRQLGDLGQSPFAWFTA